MFITILKFLVLPLFYTFIIVTVIIGLFPLVLKKVESEETTFREKFKRSVRRVYRYKWNILLIVAVASVIAEMPELQAPWFGGISVNGLCSSSVLSVGGVVTLLTNLPALGRE